LFAECLALEIAVDYKWGIPYVLSGLAELACERSDHERTVILLAAADASIDASGARMDPNDRADFERNLATARNALTPEVFSAAWETGRAMSLEQAINYARS